MLLKGKLTDLSMFGISRGNGYGDGYGHSSKVNNGLEIITTQTLKETL